MARLAIELLLATIICSKRIHGRGQILRSVKPSACIPVEQRVDVQHHVERLLVRIRCPACAGGPAFSFRCEQPIVQRSRSCTDWVLALVSE